MKFYNEHVFTKFMTHVLNILSTLICLNIKKVGRKILWDLFIKVQPEKSLSFIFFVKFTKD